MDKQTLLKRFEQMVEDFERKGTFGSIEVCFNRGRAEVIRTLVSEKFFSERENTREQRNFQR